MILMFECLAIASQAFLVSSMAEALRAVRMRPVAAAWAKTLAVAAPMPLLAPVMTAVNGVGRVSLAGSMLAGIWPACFGPRGTKVEPAQAGRLKMKSSGLADMIVGQILVVVVLRLCDLLWKLDQEACV